jgi:hypothetical protein
MGYSPGPMAKQAKPTFERSVLWASFQAYQRGDSVEARRLAQAALAGQRGPQDEKTAKELARELSSELAQVPDTIEAVAQELVSRTVVPPKPYLMVAAVAAAYAFLVILAIVRY